MLAIAILIAIFLVYLLNFRNNPEPLLPQKTHKLRRVGDSFAYNDVTDESIEILPMNTVTGPGGGSMFKNFV